MKHGGTAPRLLGNCFVMGASVDYLSSYWLVEIFHGNMKHSLSLQSDTTSWDLVSVMRMILLRSLSKIMGREFKVIERVFGVGFSVNVFKVDLILWCRVYVEVRYYKVVHGYSIVNYVYVKNTKPSNIIIFWISTSKTFNYNRHSCSYKLKEILE